MEESNKNLDEFFAIEKVTRYLAQEERLNVFFDLEIPIPSSLALQVDNKFEFSLDLKVGEKEINLVEKRVQFKSDRTVFENSHEDPPIIIGENHYLSMAIEVNELMNKVQDSLSSNVKDRAILKYKVTLVNKKGSLVVVNKETDWQGIADLAINTLHTQRVSPYEFMCSKAAKLTFHCTTIDGKYKEISKDLKAKEVVSIESILKDYVYLGIQFSILELDGRIDLEEKFIVKGQKGMRFSDLLVIDDMEIFSNIVFDKKYLNRHLIKNKCMENESVTLNGFVEINSIKDLIKGYKEGIFTPRYFEMQFEFLEDDYKNYVTYAQSGVFSTKPQSKFLHTSTGVCKDCNLKSCCIQNIPSNLSQDLSKKMMICESKEDCDVYEILQKCVKEKEISK